MERDILVQLFDQIIKGFDIPTPKGMLRVRKEVAAAKHSALPYSLATNLAHAVFWQNIWLDKLEGRPSKPSMEVWTADWRVASASDWDALRTDFVNGLNRAREIAASTPFEHEMASDDKAIDILLRIAVHGSYHMGQMNLLKRARTS